MFPQDQLNQFTTQLENANNLLILLPPKPNSDLLAAATSLHLSLIEAGKKSRLGCSSDVKVGDANIFGIDQVKKTIGQQNLIVSFPYKENAVEHVSYDIDEDSKTFNLTIKPKSGHAPLDTSAVNYSHSGAAADLVIVLGIGSLEELGRLYSDEKDFLDSSTIASLSLTSQSPAFSAINLSTNQASSLSEAVASLLQKAKLTPTSDAATNLFRQLTKSTDNFASPKVSADSFETAAFLLRAGAQRTPPSPQPKASEQPPHPAQIANHSNQPSSRPSGIPADWQGPKIYRGSSTPN